MNTSRRAHARELDYYDREAERQRKRSPRAFRVLEAISPVYCAWLKRLGHDDPLLLGLDAAAESCCYLIDAGEDLPEEMAAHMLSKLEDRA